MTAMRTRVLGGLSLVALAACTNSNGVPSTPPGSPAANRRLEAPGKAGKVTTQYVQLVIFENESYDQVIGSSQAPYITGLSKSVGQHDAKLCDHAPERTQLSRIVQRFDARRNVRPMPSNVRRNNLGSELLAAKISFRGYAESMPSKGFTGCQAVPDTLPSGYLYMRKHVPWTDFTNLPKSVSQIYKKPFSKPPGAIRLDHAEHV